MSDINRTNVPSTMPDDTQKPVIVRGEGGRFMKGTVPPKTIQTPADARSLAEKRWEKARKATASRVMQEAQSIDPDVKDEYDAHALMMAKQYTTILDSDRPRMDDAEKLAQAMGTMPRNAELRQGNEQAGPQVDDTIRALGEFAAQIRDLLQSDVIPMRQEITVVEPDE